MYIWIHIYVHTYTQTNVFMILFVGSDNSWPPSPASQHPIDTFTRATHCNILQHTATNCNTLQHTATSDRPIYTHDTLQHTTTLCNILQHNATQCNTPPHPIDPFTRHMSGCSHGPRERGSLFLSLSFSLPLSLSLFTHTTSNRLIYTRKSRQPHEKLLGITWVSNPATRKDLAARTWGMFWY